MGGEAEANPGHLPGGGRKWGWKVGWPSWIGKQPELPLSAQAPCPSVSGYRRRRPPHSLLPPGK